MKIAFKSILIAFVALTAFSSPQGENVEFSCLKKHKASNTCHFNFVIDGARYRFVDMGCKYEKKKDDVIKKAKEGNLALAKDWKIECPAVKDDKEKEKPAAGF
jgi:hypothetical protein